VAYVGAKRGLVGPRLDANALAAADPLQIRHALADA